MNGVTKTLVRSGLVWSGPAIRQNIQYMIDAGIATYALVLINPENPNWYLLT